MILFWGTKCGGFLGKIPIFSFPNHFGHYFKNVSKISSKVSGNESGLEITGLLNDLLGVLSYSANRGWASIGATY